MKFIKLKNLQVNLQLSVGYKIGSVEGKANYQVFLYKDKDKESGVSYELDYCDDEDVTYMGKPIEGYEEVGKLWKLHKEMGIDLNKMVLEKCDPQVKSYLDTKGKELFPF